MIWSSLVSVDAQYVCGFARAIRLKKADLSTGSISPVVMMMVRA